MSNTSQKRRRAQRITVHWTAHACLAVDPAAQRPDYERLRFGDPGSDRVYAVEHYAGLIKGTWFGCEIGRRKPLDPTANHYTNRLADVTCERCIARYDELTSGWWAETRGSGPIPAMLAAHKLCCADRGAPLLADPDELIQYGRNEAARRLRMMFSSATCSAMLGMYDHDAIAKVANEVPEGLRESLRGVLDELTMGADLVAEVTRLQGRAEAALLAVTERIRTGDMEIAEGELTTLLEGECRVPESGEQLAKEYLNARLAELKAALAEADALEALAAEAA